MRLTSSLAHWKRSETRSKLSQRQQATTMSASAEGGRVSTKKRKGEAVRLINIPEDSSPSVCDSLPQCNRFQRLRNSRSSHLNDQKMLDTNMFESYLEDLWNSISEDKRSSSTYLDCLWFSMHKNGLTKEKLLEWIKKKQLFSRNYVFVPIVCWRHWSLLILCNLGENMQSKTKKPCMLLLDSLQQADPKKLEPDIRRFVLDIYKVGERKERKEILSKIPLLIPKVPQQTNGEECGVFALYFLYLFIQNAPENFSLEGYPYFLKEDWFSLGDLESFRKDLESIPFGCGNKEIVSIQ